jgi:hypothetical protein
MLVGAAPFDASSVLAVVQHHYFTPPPDIRKVREGIPPALVAIIERLVAKDPAHRFTSTNHLLAALEALPFHAHEQRIARETLRHLARGYRVPIVPTGVLPPLPDARQSGQSLPQAQSGTRRARRLTLGMVAAVLTAAGAWWGTQPGGADGPSPAQSDVPLPADSAPALAARSDSGGLASRDGDTTPARRRASPSDAAATPSGRGLVRLRTNPADAVIYIDDREVGVGTLFDVEVPAGTRRLRIKAPGAAPLDTTFTVRPGATTRLGLIALRDVP